MGHVTRLEHGTALNSATSAESSATLLCGTHSGTQTRKRTYPESFRLPSTEGRETAVSDTLR